LARGELDFKEAESLRRWGEAIGRVCEQAHRIIYGERYTVTVEGLRAFAARFARVVNRAIDEYIEDDGQAQAIREAIGRGLAGVIGTGPTVEDIAINSDSGARPMAIPD
jgi:hypothetical protein